MPTQAQKIVLLSRYTSLVGMAVAPITIYTPAVHARGFASADIVAWMGYRQAGSYSFTLQESTDLLVWVDKGSIAVSSNVEQLTSFTPLETEWVRVKITLSQERFTCWMVGDFTLRGV